MSFEEKIVQERERRKQLIEKQKLADIRIANIMADYFNYDVFCFARSMKKGKVESLNKFSQSYKDFGIEMVR